MRLVSLWIAVALLELGCGVTVEDRVRRCDESFACAEDRVCLDGYCVDAQQSHDALELCESPAVLATPNLVTNDSFEQSSAGWETEGGTVEHLSEGFAGTHALRSRSS